ncbi:NADH-quinone oxidoreductase subunit K [Roseibium alexandrii]|uniref:Multisubunit Na+/H+ antiporter, MnhC subunit n=1 Tax=Roseibium alexandrii (strain DSM 17067 / NCIMB 14079 / DFL-11) TaxID=244592 RepID=A0A5E8H747_ROSAD|nr:NADH-quinone oxidoreductase subunit K [Roseibium alexandrii]EEE47892.1 Multisubunit Na+/H+ antiporter, MnhC subunit [Roseibium alexandrii DFL-11]
MIYVYAATIVIVAGAGIYMILAQNIVRIILGVALLAASANLLIFLSGRLGSVTPPIIRQDAEVLGSYAANPLPQALVLTAIVIGFALTAYAVALAVKGYKSLGTMDTSQMHDAEELGSPFAAKSAPKQG